MALRSAALWARGRMNGIFMKVLSGSDPSGCLPGGETNTGRLRGLERRE
jgi:hypothetical protein